ncbi:hypothetical protein Tco_0572720 [Tanacetum coccineum]
MLAPKCATYNGRSTFANPKYLKKAQSEKPRLYEIPYDTFDPANRFCPNGEETVTLEKESRSKLDKDKVKPYDYTYQNSLYETFKPPSKTYLDQLERAKEVRKTIAFPNPTAKSMEVLIKTLLMSLSNKTILDSHCFVHELKTKMHDDLEYVKSLEKEIDKLESEKADFSNIYDLLLEDYKKLIETSKESAVETQFNKPSVVRQPNAQRIPKPSVLGKPTPFSNSPEMRSFQTKQSVNKTNVSDGLFKQVTQQNLPQIRKQAVRNTNVIAPGPSMGGKAKKSAQLQKDKEVNGKPSMIDPANLPNTANGTSFNGQKQQRIDLNADALYNEKQENLRVWLLKLLISKKPVPECYEALLRPTPLPEYPTRDFTMSTSSLQAEKTIYTSLTRREERSLNNNSFLGEYECSSLALDRDERRDEKKRLDHLKQDQTMLVIKRFSKRKKVFRERKKTGKIRAKRLYLEEHPRCCQAKGSKVEEKLVHLMMVMKFEVLIEKKKVWLDEVSLVGGVFDGAFGGVGDEEVVVGEGVVRFSSSFMRSTKSCFGGMMEEDVFSWLDEVSLVGGVFDGAFRGVGDEEVVVGEGVVRFSSSFMRSTKSCFGGFEEDEDDKKSVKDGLFN